MDLSSLDDISDDEVFFGAISLKECKKRLFLNSSCDRHSLPETSETIKEKKHDDSIQIIETNSEPNVSYLRPSLSSPDSITNVTKSVWDIKPTDDSNCDRQSLLETSETIKEKKHDDSIQIIETNSEPNVSYLSSPDSITNVTKSVWDIKPTDDSNCDRQSLLETSETIKEKKHDDSIQIIETNSEPNVSYLSSPDSITNVTKSVWDIKPTDDSNCDRQSLLETSETIKENKHDGSIQIIETNSGANVSYARPSLSSSDSITNVNKSAWDIKPTDDSFIQLEKMVSEMCVSPKSNNNDDFNNTLEVIDYILKNPITKNNNHEGEFPKSDSECVEPLIKESPIKLLNCYEKLQFYKTEMKNEDGKYNMNLLQESPSKIKVESNHSNYVNTETLVVPTPIMQTKHNFKTPKSTLSTIKHIQASSTKKTPNKINAYQNIKSPVAFYINKCPQVPLIKDVHLKRPLNNSTYIPKIINTPKGHKANNKENISLPSVAYKSAKATKMISIPDTEKLPKGEWVKKISTSLPRPVVIKHSHRKVEPMCQPSDSNSEESFVGLPLKQADLSVCTQKSAFTKIK